jgi:hypothetical protein
MPLLLAEEAPQLCAGLQFDIEANLHAVCAIWQQSTGWTEDLGAEKDNEDPVAADTLHYCVCADGMLNPLEDPGGAENTSNSRYEEGTGFGSALFDARHGFNKLNRYLMLLNLAHLWNCRSRFAFNRHCHWVRCLVRTEPGESSIVIHSKGGIRQGNCFAMSLYGVALMPLVSKIREASPRPCSHGTVMMQARLARLCPMLAALTSL